jgi:Tol biopolymer transport system component
MIRRVMLGLVMLGLLGLATDARAQTFGRNKVQYRTFDFQVLRTEHFDVYYYPEESEAARMVGRLAERWRERLGRFFDHDLRGRQTVILYAAPAHFRQTNAIEGVIGEGTGGVTEANRRRIVLPMGGSLADTDHVLGHELVHAYQFDMTGTTERMTDGSAPAILEFPLWFVEGMAEYVSLGAVDAQTAMWMRDGVIREKLPRVQDLDKPEFFPYRWGHAFWAYVGAKWGDRWVASLLRSSANPRADLDGFAAQLGTTRDGLNAGWHQAMRDATLQIERDRPSITSAARRAIGRDTGGGRLNVGPKLSTDGASLVFFSEKDLFSVELFLANAGTGQIERKLVRSASDPHFDSLQFLNSAGAWSREGRALAMTAVRQGKPVLVLLDVALGQVIREVPLIGLSDALSPVWAPDGLSIVLSGNRGGLMDLYRVTVATGAVEALTRDPYAELEPAFTPDGASLVFSTDRFSTDLTGLVPGPLRLARMNLATRDVQPIAGFLRGKHLSPQVSPDGRTLTFVGEPDGVANIYRMSVDGGPITQLTSFATGIAGITATSPALSMATGTGRLAFSVFEEGGAAVYILDEADLVSMVSPPLSTRGSLLPSRTTPDGVVQQIVTDFTRGLPAATKPAASEPYPGRLLLDAVGQPSVTAGVSSWGGYVGGSVSALFRDVLGDRIVSTGAQVAGTLDDLGGWFTYISRRHRWNWGMSVEQAPYRAELLTATRNVEQNELVADSVIERQLSRGLFGLAEYPFSQSKRLEFSGGARRLSFSREHRVSTYNLTTGSLLGRAHEKASVGRPLNLAEGRVAFVHDTSFFGPTSPIYGRRYRLELAQSVGTLRYQTLMLDARQYLMPVRPVTIGVRALHFGRYGRDAEDKLLVPLFIGYPEMVHGYGFGSFDPAECTTPDASPTGLESTLCGSLDNLVGSRVAVANIEVRAPIPGVFRGQLDYGRVPVELVAFFDAGVTWSRQTRPAFAGGSRILTRAAGAAVRVNVFGLFALELSAAHPFDRPDKSLRWQLGVRTGF